jgi:two-component system, sensor histidine kinase YesM
MAKRSIRTKMLTLMLAAVVLPMGVSVTVSYFYTKESVTRKSVQENARILSLGKEKVSDYIGGLNQLAFTVYSGINLPGSLYTSIAYARPDADQEISVDPWKYRNPLYNLYQSKDGIYQVHLYIAANKQSHSLVQGHYRSERNERFPAPFEPGDDPKPYIEKPHMDHRYGMSSNVPNHKLGTMKVFSLHYPIFRTPSKDVMAYLSFDVKLSELQHITGEMYDRNAEEELYILSTEGSALFASREDVIRTQAIFATGLDLRSEYGYEELEAEGFQGILLYAPLRTPIFQGVIVKLIPYSRLYADTRGIATINAGIGLLFLFMGSIAAIQISIHFTSPIKRLITFANQIQIGRLDAHAEVEREDEFGLLTHKLTSMTQAIHQLVQKEYRLELANKTNQLKALQAQINPHFLYNALQSIASSALRQQDTRGYDLIQYLGTMMRYTMDTETSVVPLRDEIEYVKCYLALQQERFGDHLRVTMKIAPETQAIPIPKISIQPFAENVFKHGFRGGIYQGGEIGICSYLSGDFLWISVSDTGSGMGETARRDLERLANTGRGTGALGIGIPNVLERLRLNFGEQVRLFVESEAGGGSIFKLSIPFKQEHRQEVIVK